MSLISRWKYLFSQHPNLHIIIHRVTVELQVAYLRYLKKVDIGEDCTVHRHAKIDGRNPKRVHIGDRCRIAARAIIFAHDYYGGGDAVDTYIGNQCIIGYASIILPGVRLGDNVIVGAGSVVSRDVPSNCIVAGNPAKIIKINIEIDKHGRITNHGERPQKL